jgi:hypothetical protein
LAPQLQGVDLLLELQPAGATLLRLLAGQQGLHELRLGAAQLAERICRHAGGQLLQLVPLAGGVALLLLAAVSVQQAVERCAVQAVDVVVQVADLQASQAGVVQLCVLLADAGPCGESRDHTCTCIACSCASRSLMLAATGLSPSTASKVFASSPMNCSASLLRSLATRATPRGRRWLIRRSV